MPRARERNPLADLLGARKDPAFERLARLIESLAGLLREDSKRGLEQAAEALTRTEAISAELQAVAETGELGSAKTLLRRLETAVDAAHSALSSTLPEDAPK